MYKKQKMANLIQITIVIILVNLLIVNQNVLSQKQGETEYNPVNLFMYGNADRGDLLTEVPTSSTDTKADCPVTGATPGVMILVGQWYTKYLSNSMTIHGKYSFELWADGTGNGVQFDVQLHHNGDEVTRCFSEQKNVNGPTLFKGAVNNIDLEAKAGDTIEIWIYFSYYDIRNVEILYGSIEHNSHITIVSNPINIVGIEAKIEEKIGIITTTFTESFGSDPAKLNYTISILGQTDVKTLSNPIIEGTANETNATNMSVVQWIWDFKKDKAKVGQYLITIKIGYDVNTSWESESVFELTIEDKENGDNDISIPIFITVVVIVVAIGAVIYKKRY